MSVSPRALTIAIVAGEASGDALGASLVKTLRARSIDASLIGVGGRALTDQGLTSFFPQADINLMGVAAVAQRLPLLLRRIRETARAIAAASPDLLLTIDSPDFSLRVTKKVRALAPDIPIVHWVCPSVWAWRPGRARKMAPHVDRVLCLLPFEPEELRKLGGPKGIYVNHPLIERLGDLRPRSAEELAARDDVGAPEILLLPGSRRTEVSRLIGVIGDAAARIAAIIPGARFTLAAVDHVRPLIDAAVRSWRAPVDIVAGEEAKLAAFRRARAAIAASGTVTLELALAGIPTVAIYRLAGWEAFIARRMIRVPSVLLPNLILDRNAMPELLQENCTAERVAAALMPLIVETAERAAQRAAFAELATRMIGDGASPSAHAADAILELLAEKKTPPRA